MFQRFLATLTVLGAVAAAQTLDRTKAPDTPPIPGYKLPPVFETKLPNGLSVVLVEDARFPLVTARLNFMAGSKFDPKDAPGLSEAVASLLTEGTKTRNSRQLSEEADSLGGGIGGNSGSDALVITGNSVSDNLPKLLDLMADVARNANFPQDEVDLYKQNRIQDLLGEHADPGFLAREKFAEVVYGSTPYAHIAPTPASIQKLDAKELAAFRDKYLTPNNATLVLLGKLPARDELMKILTDRFGSWQQKPLPAAPKMDLPTPKRQIVLVDRPGSVQADIHIGRLAPTRTSTEFFPMKVGTDVLGGGANSRMFRNIREKEGFAYDAHAEYATKRDAAHIVAITQVRNEVIEPALKAMISELEQMASTPVPAPELTSIKNHQAGNYLIGLETQDGLASQLNTMKTLGLPNNYLETYVTRVRSVEPDGMLAAAKKYMAPGDDTIVVVGDASKIADALKKFGNVTVAKVE